MNVLQQSSYRADTAVFLQGFYWLCFVNVPISVTSPIFPSRPFMVELKLLSLQP